MIAHNYEDMTFTGTMRPVVSLPQRIWIMIKHTFIAGIALFTSDYLLFMIQDSIQYRVNDFVEYLILGIGTVLIYKFFTHTTNHSSSFTASSSDFGTHTFDGSSDTVEGLDK